VRDSHAAALGLALTFLAGCASSTPYFSGARTTPSGRADVFLGSAVRAPLGDIRRNDLTRTDEERSLLTLLGREGVAPVEGARIGLSDHVDVGVLVSATSVALGARRAFVLDEDTRIVLGLTPRMGFLTGDDARGLSFGVDVPAVLALNFAGIYEVWTGIRAGIDSATGRVGEVTDLSMTGIRAGAVLGVSAGFRTLAVLVELAADYEWWRGSVGANASSLSGVVLTPAFAIRIRL
jgi:hypothetical protein